MASDNGGDKSLKIAVGGASGLIGTRLCAALGEKGHRIVRLVRPASQSAGDEDSVPWQPSRGMLDPADLEGIDVAIHLGGENVASGRWTAKRKARLRDSRILSTRLLADTLRAMATPPRSFLCASAVGIYGDRGDEALNEQSELGGGFLAEIGRAWEAEAQEAEKAGARVVNLRFGIVLSAEGGALAKMLTPFRLGLGGRLGDGRQYMSWIGLEDAVRAIVHCLENENLRGPVNLTSPQPATNAAFTQTLGKVLGRPTLAPVPAWTVRTLFGEMGRTLLLESARVLPEKLVASGFIFRRGELESALREALA